MTRHCYSAAGARGARAAFWAALLVWAAWVEGPGFVRGLYPPPGRPNDFFASWAAARDRLAGRPAPAAFDEAVPRHLGLPAPEGRQPAEADPRLPTATLLALPLAAADYPDAALAWNVLCLAALALSAGLI